MSPSPRAGRPEDLYLKAFEKAEARKRSGCDPLAADWQAILEIALNLASGHLREKPGCLLPLQIGNDEEWEFYLALQEKLDLPPDTYAVLSTPSFSESVLDAMDDPDLGIGECQEVPWGKDAYLAIISDCHEHVRIMQVSLPSGSGKARIDVYEDGKHLAEYAYHTIEECMAELAKVPWVFFSPKGDWSADQIIRYTENCFVKGFDGRGLGEMAMHSDFSYVHHPELLDLTSLQSVFRLLETTIPAALECLELAIETTNELSQDLELGETVVTREGILQGNQEQCRALAARIAVEMDQQLDELEGLAGTQFPDRKDGTYLSHFDRTTRRIYEKTTGRSCPKLAKP